jgi:hypothetical protein
MNIMQWTHESIRLYRNRTPIRRIAELVGSTLRLESFADSMMVDLALQAKNEDAKAVYCELINCNDQELSPGSDTVLCLELREKWLQKFDEAVSRQS